MPIEQKKQRGHRSKYPPELRRDAVGLVLDDGRTIADVARSVGEGTLGNWVAKERDARGELAGLSSDERTELVEL